MLNHHYPNSASSRPAHTSALTWNFLEDISIAITLQARLSQEARNSLRLHYVLPGNWDQLLLRRKCPGKCILASIHDCIATGWGGTRLVPTWNTELASIGHIYSFSTCTSWTHASPGTWLPPASSYLLPYTCHFSCWGKWMGQPLWPETGPAQAAPPALQVVEAVNLRKPLAVGLGQGMGKTTGRTWILTLKCLNCNRWDQALWYGTAGDTSQQLCNTPVAKSLFRGETGFHELPLHFCQIKKNTTNHE